MGKVGAKVGCGTPSSERRILPSSARARSAGARSEALAAARAYKERGKKSDVQPPAWRDGVLSLSRPEEGEATEWDPLTDAMVDLRAWLQAVGTL